MIGDWGGLLFVPHKTPSEVAVAKAMGNLGKKIKYKFSIVIR